MLVQKLTLAFPGLWRLIPNSVRSEWVKASIVGDDRELLEKFIAIDPSTISMQTRDSEPMVVLAARLGSEEIVRYLLNRNADVDSRDGSGATALMLASLKGSFTCVELLLSQGADADARDQEGLAAASLAAANGHLEILGLLEAHGANHGELEHLIRLIAFDDFEALHDLLENSSLDELQWPLDASPLLVAAHNGSRYNQKSCFGG